MCQCRIKSTHKVLLIEDKLFFKPYLCYFQTSEVCCFLCVSRLPLSGQWRPCFGWSYCLAVLQMCGKSAISKYSGYTGWDINHFKPDHTQTSTLQLIEGKRNPRLIFKNPSSDSQEGGGSTVAFLAGGLCFNLHNQALVSHPSSQIQTETSHYGINH